MLPDTSCIHLLPSTCFLYIGNKIVASLSPVCWIQKRDTSRPWHKWIVIMSPRYSQHVSRTSNLYPATCDRQHMCIRIQVACPGHLLPGNMCPGVNAALATQWDQSASVTWASSALSDVRTSVPSNWRNAPSVRRALNRGVAEVIAGTTASEVDTQHNTFSGTCLSCLMDVISSNTTDVYFVEDAVKFNADVQCSAVKDSCWSLKCHDSLQHRTAR